MEAPGVNREDEFELLLVRWLEEGPLTAPDRPVAAAIEHARTHPRRRFSRSSLWRSAMDSMHLAPVTPRHTNNLGRALAVGLVAIVVVATTIVFGTSLLGRGGGTGAAPGGAVAPAATATPAPTSTPVAVTGTDTGSVSTQGTDTQVGDVEQMRGWTLYGLSAMSDPRVSGATTVRLNEDIHADQSADIWGTETIAGPDGTWVGTWTGLIDEGYATHRIAAVLKGTGAYLGLQYRYTLTGTSAADGVHFNTTGVVASMPSFEATAPVTARVTVTGTESCSDVQFGTTGSVDSVGGVDQMRNGFVSCTESMSDPRVNAEPNSTRGFNSDTYPGGLSNMWGTLEIPNAGGTWYGVWTGTVGADGNTAITATAIGSGGYAGLQYRVRLSSTSTATYPTVTGVIEPVE
jgi:hypothetical protein